MYFVLKDEACIIDDIPLTLSRYAPSKASIYGDFYFKGLIAIFVSKLSLYVYTDF